MVTRSIDKRGLASVRRGPAGRERRRTVAWINIVVASLMCRVRLLQPAFLPWLRPQYLIALVGHAAGDAISQASRTVPASIGR